MATEQDIEDTDAVISDNDTSTVFPDGTPAGDFDASGNPYDNPYQLHRPHAFALMHGDGGAKISYGELHWRVDLLKFKFETHTVSGISVTVDDHTDHSHAPHANHSHSDHTDHSHSSHTTTDHQHTITSDSHDGHTHSSAGSSNYATSSSGGNSADVYDTNSDSAGTSPQGSAYHHKHGGLTGFDGSETLSHSGVKNVSDGSSSAPTGVLGHSNAVNTDGSALGSDTAGVLKHSGVTATDGTTSATGTGVLEHNVTVSGSSSFVYCAQAGQESIGKINQQVPKVDAEDGKSMSANINDLDEDGIPTGAKYHQLGSYGDVYLCWKADLEQGAGSEITHCWVQVGEPNNDDIDEVPLGNSSTNRRSSSGSDGITGANDNGIYSIKLGTVNEGSPIKQNVSSDVVWTPTVIDRIGP